jgi:hypothetical protein
MSEQSFPTMKITATGERSLQVELPPVEGTQVPAIPAELRGEDVPSFVLEWIAEADEMGLIIQELLQAPTKSLCRIFRSPTYAEQQYDAPNPQFQMPQMGGEVMGFSATEAPPETIGGLPEGVYLPARLEEIISMAKRLESWIEKGRRVRAWAEEHGHGDAPWLPADL